MNVENVLKVADAIEADPVGFNMDLLSSCICGRAARLSGSDDEWPAVRELAGHKFLGLKRGSRLALDLFVYVESGASHGLSYSERARITPSQAVACLRHLAKTGKVDWTRALKSA